MAVEGGSEARNREVVYKEDKSRNEEDDWEEEEREERQRGEAYYEKPQKIGNLNKNSTESGYYVSSCR